MRADGHAAIERAAFSGICPAGLSRCALPWVYRGARAIRNRLLNLLDTPVVVLVYHRVAELADDPEMIAVAPENFRRQMAFLKGHFPVLRLEEEWDRISRAVGRRHF